MLTNLKIDGLFKRYSYNLQFQCDTDDCISILTGPNGFGKTTILNLINALYHSDYQVFQETVYNHIEFFFDGKILQVDRVVKQRQTNDDIDWQENDDIELNFYFADQTNANAQERFSLQFVSGEMQGTPSDGFELFMQTRSALYITDNRLFIQKTDRLTSTANFDDDAAMRISQELKEILGENPVATANLLDAQGELGDKLRLFNKIITESHFANEATLIMDKQFGIRFQNAAGDFILPHQLSSGEKHILIQTFELIFKAQSGAIVLIDEPEISFHPAWVAHYLDVIKRIQQLKSAQNKSLQVLIATHSPILIGQRWDITRDLYNLYQA